jgi:hypothetical protein
MNKKYDNLDEYKMAVLSDCIKSTDIMKKSLCPKAYTNIGGLMPNI